MAIGNWTTPDLAGVFTKNSNPVADMASAMDEVSLFAETEPGISHPVTTSSLKLRDNGNIEVFVATNNGIRICPENASVNLLASLVRTSATDIKMDAGNSIDIHSLMAINVNCDIAINVVGGKTVTVKSGGPVDIVGAGDVNIKSGGNMNFSAKRYNFS